MPPAVRPVTVVLVVVRLLDTGTQVPGAALASALGGAAPTSGWVVDDTAMADAPYRLDDAAPVCTGQTIDTVPLALAVAVGAKGPPGVGGGRATLLVEVVGVPTVAGVPGVVPGMAAALATVVVAAPPTGVGGSGTRVLSGVVLTEVST